MVEAAYMLAAVVTGEIKLEAGDGAEAAAAKKLSDERWVAGKADRDQSHKLAVALPKFKEMVELRDKRRDLRKQVIAACRAAAAAARRVANRSITRGRGMLGRDATRRGNCRTCRQLDELASPCALLSRGTGLNTSPYSGGSHAGNRSLARPGIHSHHMSAQSAYPPSTRRGGGWRPAIQMDIADHMQTASYGSGADADRHQRAQRRLLRRGRLREAFLMDVLDIRSKSGDKYDGAIAEAAA